MTVDYEAWRFWRDNLNLLFTVAIGVYVWWSNREKVTASRFLSLEKEVAKRATATELEKAKTTAATGLEGVREEVRKHQAVKCGEHLNRTSALEVTLKATPTNDDLGKVYDRINQVGGAVEGVKGSLTQINNNVNLLVEHHLKGGRK